MTILETARLVLRPIVREDAEAIYEYSREPNVGPNAGWKPHDSLDETLAIMDAFFLPTDAVFAVVVKEKGTLIGTMGLVPDAKRENKSVRMLGYALGERYWGHGFATEAVAWVVGFGFLELGLDGISAYCYPGNLRSKRVLEKNGFQYEGRLKLCETVFDGRVESNDCYLLPASR